MVEFSDLFDDESDVFQKKAKVGMPSALPSPSSYALRPICKMSNAILKLDRLAEKNGGLESHFQSLK